MSQLTYEDTIKGEKDTDTLAVVNTPEDFDMWIPNTTAERSFDGISGFEILAFGTLSTSYTIAGTKTIRLSGKVRSAGITTIDASNTSGAGNDVLELDASQFSSRTNLTFIGSNDKDVNVKFTGGSGHDTLPTGTINEDAGDTLTGGLGEDTFNIKTNKAAVITDLGVGGPDLLVLVYSQRSDRNSHSRLCSR